MVQTAGRTCARERWCYLVISLTRLVVGLGVELCMRVGWYGQVPNATRSGLAYNVES